MSLEKIHKLITIRNYIDQSINNLKLEKSKIKKLVDMLPAIDNQILDLIFSEESIADLSDNNDIITKPLKSSLIKNKYENK